MFKRIVSQALIFTLVSSSSLFAADRSKAIDLPAAIAKAAREEAKVEAAKAEAARQQAARGTGRMPPVYKWVGIGLLVSGAISFISTVALYGENSSTCDNFETLDMNCGTYRTIFYVESAVSLAAGAIVLGIGATKRTAPSLTFRKGGVALEKRITF